MSWSQLLPWPSSSLLGSCPTLLPPPLDPSSHQASLHFWPKSRSSSLSSPSCSLFDQQKIHPSVLLTHASDQELLLSSWKLDGPVCHCGLSNFPILRPSCPTGGRRVCNGRLLHSSLCGQNPQQVLAIPGGSASAVVPMVRTTPPKEDKVDTSLAEAQTAQTLVA
jgi:hypothetical protein